MVHLLPLILHCDFYLHFYSSPCFFRPAINLKPMNEESQPVIIDDEKFSAGLKHCPTPQVQTNLFKIQHRIFQYRYSVSLNRVIAAGGSSFFQLLSSGSKEFIHRKQMLFRI